MTENKNLIKLETWFDYYKRVYDIFKKIALIDNYNNFSNGDNKTILSIHLSFLNSVPQEDDFGGIGQVVKLELFKNHSLVHEISLKATSSEEELFQYIWMLVVNHFIQDNYSKDSKIKIVSDQNSTRGFKYLLSDIKINGESIVRANFALSYNKQEYDNMLHYLVLNHNNYHDNYVLVQNVRNFILNNVHRPISPELNNSINQSRKVYEDLVHTNNRLIYKNNRFAA